VALAPAQALGRAEPSLSQAVRHLFRGALSWTLVGIGALEAANITFTLLILRATKLLEEGRSVTGAVIVAVSLFLGYRLAGAAAATVGGQGDGPPRRAAVAGGRVAAAAWRLRAGRAPRGGWRSSRSRS
jgi:hypothetical protein